MADAHLGSVVGGHRITRLIGRGGMGVVYEAVDLSLDRTVAIKLVAPELAEEASFRDRFVSESKIAASIDHPNVLPIYSAGEHDGLLFLAMRYVVGRDLRSLVEEDGPLAPARAAHIVAQVGQALDAAHARQLVHRDVKPANVLVTQHDHAYLTDFGLVKDLALSVGPTATGQLLGTFDYVAPELIQGEAVGPWTDVYALGCVLFFALTGTVVFPLDTPQSKLWAHIRDPPPSVSALRPDITSEFDGVVARAMAKDPHERFESASALGAAAVEAASANLGAVVPADGGVLDAPIARLVAAARQSEAGIRAATAKVRRDYSDVSQEVEALLDTMEHTAEHAQLLSRAIEQLPKDEFERRLSEVRSSRLSGKAQLVDALAKQLQVQRTMETRLDTFYADMERIVVELETVRGELLSAATSEDANAERRLAGSVRALRDELGALDQGLETIIARGRELDLAPPATPTPVPSPARPRHRRASDA